MQSDQSIFLQCFKNLSILVPFSLGVDMAQLMILVVQCDNAFIFQSTLRKKEFCLKLRAHFYEERCLHQQKDS